MKTFSNEEILKIKDPHKEDRELLKFCLILFAVFVIISSLFTANFINVKVVGASMENTLHNNWIRLDHLLTQANLNQECERFEEIDQLIEKYQLEHE